MRESNAKKLVISVTAVMLSAALLFVFLYRYDNKYTHGRHSLYAVYGI